MEDITIGGIIQDVLQNPWSYAIIVAWLYISWRMAVEQDETFISRLVKNFFFLCGMAIFHEVLPTLFWIVTGLTLAVSAVLAIIARGK